MCRILSILSPSVQLCMGNGMVCHQRLHLFQDANSNLSMIKSEIENANFKKGCVIILYEFFIGNLHISARLICFRENFPYVRPMFVSMHPNPD